MTQTNDIAATDVVAGDISVGRVLRSPALLTRECLAGVITALALEHVEATKAGKEEH